MIFYNWFIFQMNRILCVFRDILMIFFIKIPDIRDSYSLVNSEENLDELSLDVF